MPRVGNAPSVMTPQTVGSDARDDQGRAPAPAHAEEAEAGGVVVGTGPQVRERGLEVADLVVA